MYWYFPCPEPKSIGQGALGCLAEAMHVLADWTPPHVYDTHWGHYDFRIDTNMTTENGVLGYTKLLSNVILLSPEVTKALAWKNNNEIAMSTVVHELTHRAQMKWAGGVLWPLLNLPIICDLTIEDWACENGESACKFLTEAYARTR